jgi:uncharacterized protein YegP (UPF0339 family)
MSSESTGNDGVVNWYESNIGEPETRDEAYGYLTFVAGLLAGLLGILLFLMSSPASGTRELAIVAAALGLLLLLIGPIVRLPLRGSATVLAYVGALVSLLAILWFSLTYPTNWRPQASLVVPLYAVGVLTIGLGGIVVPLVTETTSRTEHHRVAAELSELRGELVDAEADEADLADRVAEFRRQLADAEADEADLANSVVELRHSLKDAEADEADLAAQLQTLKASQARFELFEDTGGEFRWRLRHRNGNVIADSGEGYTQRHNAKKGLQSVRRNALGATVIQHESEGDVPEEGTEFEPVVEAPSQGTFEVYEDDAGEHRWRLVHENGNVLADSGEGYASDRNVRRAIESVKERVPPAVYLRFDPAAFETYRDRGGDWRWRLVHENGSIIADSGEGYASHSNARRAANRIRDAVDEMDFEVYEDSVGEYRWRLTSGNDIVADSGEGYASRDGAEAAVDRVTEYAPDAGLLEIGQAAFEVYEDAADEYRWRLRHRNGNILADCGEGYTDRTSVLDAIESVKRDAPNGPVQSA